MSWMRFVDTDTLISRYCNDMESAEKAETDRLRSGVTEKKATLSKKLDGLRIRIGTAKKSLEGDLL